MNIPYRCVTYNDPRTSGKNYRNFRAKAAASDHSIVGHVGAQP